MGLQVFEWINYEGLNALKALPKGFIVFLPATHNPLLGDLTLVSWSKRLSLASLVLLLAYIAKSSIPLNRFRITIKI